jgi:hypothetical protein
MSNVHRKKDILLSLLYTDYVTKIKYWKLPTVTTVSFLSNIIKGNNDANDNDI